MKIITLAALALVLSSLVGAQDKPPPKPFVYPPAVKETSGFAVNPVILSDAACAADYFTALGFDGVEKRKRLSDLVETRCLRTLRGIYFAFVSENSVTDPRTKQRWPYVSLVYAASIMRALFHVDLDAPDQSRIVVSPASLVIGNQNDLREYLAGYGLGKTELVE